MASKSEFSGCFLWLRRAAVEKVGPFDEGYGKYFEDVDMCRRIARAGWSVLYHGAASCYHLETRASKRLLSAEAWRHFRAYLHWLRRWGLHPPKAAVARFDAPEATVPGPLAPDNGPLTAAPAENVLAFPALGAEQMKV